MSETEPTIGLVEKTVTLCPEHSESAQPVLESECPHCIQLLLDRERNAHDRTDSQWGQVLKVLQEYQSERRIHFGGYSPADMLKATINDCRKTETNAMQGMKEFRDDVLLWLKVFQHLVEGVHRAATHRSKEIRAEMLLEEIASAGKKLREKQFDFHGCYRWWDDVFATDYPTRQYVQRIHELEDELKELRAEKNGEPKAEPVQAEPF